MLIHHSLGLRQIKEGSVSKFNRSKANATQKRNPRMEHKKRIFQQGATILKD